VDDSISLGDSGLEFAPYTLMIEYEMLDTSSYQMIAAKTGGNGGGTNWGELRSNNTALEFKGIDQNPDVSIGSALAVNRIYRTFVTVAGSGAGSAVQIFHGEVGGNLNLTENVLSGGLASPNKPWRFGKRDDGYYAHMRIYQARLYDRVVAESQIRAIFYDPYDPLIASKSRLWATQAAGGAPPSSTDKLTTLQNTDRGVGQLRAARLGGVLH